MAAVDVYQIKNIMDTLHTTRPRVNHIAKECGIPADIRQASGPGTSNLYSFGGVMQFAIAQALLNLDMKHNTVKDILESVRNYNANKDFGLFDVERKSCGKIELKLKFNVGSLLIVLEDREKEVDTPFAKDGELKKYGSVVLKGNPGYFRKDKPHSTLKVDLGLMKADLLKALRG